MIYRVKFINVANLNDCTLSKEEVQVITSRITRFKKVRTKNRIEESRMTKGSLKEIQMTKIFKSFISVQ